VAVHKGFNALDTVPHVLTSFEVLDHKSIQVVMPAAVPNKNWLVPGTPSAGQQKYGDALLAKHVFVAIPSAVSSFSWNLIFDADRATGHYKLLAQTAFALDTRLNPPVP
jgi:RES domain-containing protein